MNLTRAFTRLHHDGLFKNPTKRCTCVAQHDDNREVLKPVLDSTLPTQGSTKARRQTGNNLTIQLIPLMTPNPPHTHKTQTQTTEVAQIRSSIRIPGIHAKQTPGTRIPTPSSLNPAPQPQKPKTRRHQVLVHNSHLGLRVEAC